MAVTNKKGIYALYLPSTWTGYAPYTLTADFDGKSATKSVKVKMCISPIVTEDGLFKAEGSSVPQVNNLIDQNFTQALAPEPETPEPDPEPEPEPEEPSEDPPAGVVGDFFAEPIRLIGASGSHTIADTSGFTKEPGEPIHDGSEYPESHSA